MKRWLGGLVAALYVVACFLPGEPSGAGRIEFRLDFPLPVRVPLAGVVEPLVTISADGQVLRNPSYRLETLDAGVVRVDSTERHLLGVERGTATVRVTYLGATGTPDTVFPVQVVISRVAVDSPSLAFTRLGARTRLSAIAFDADDAAVPNVTFAWSSADSTVATVNDTGLVTAVDEGTVTITAEADSVMGLASVTVTQVAAQVRLIPQLDTLHAVGRTVQFIAVVLDSGGGVLPGARPRWTTSAPMVATVDGAGRTTATGAGTARIIARVGEAADTATLVVTQVIRYFVVTPGYDTLTAIADTGRLVALAFDSLNFPIANPNVAWTTSDGTVATVDEGGLVRAAKDGVVLVTASAAGQSAFATVLVRQDVVAAWIAPDNVALTGAGDTVRLSAVAVDRNGFVVQRETFTWRSSFGFIATVDTTGLVTARVDGTVGIVATSRMGGWSDTATVSVTGAPRPPELIAFESLCSYHCSLEVVAVDGSGRSPAVLWGGSTTGPAWSQNGARLAFSTVSYLGNVYVLGIAYVEFGGSPEVRFVTRQEGAYDWDPAWSPDGTKIAFIRWLGGPDTRIWVVNADGSNARELDVRLGGNEPSHLAWSPDGTKLAFSSWSSQREESDILVMNADGSGRIDTLTTGGAPDWSPDGSQLAFHDWAGDAIAIWLMNSDGSGRRVLTRGVGSAVSPAWSPDGTRIVFVSRGEGLDLYVINRDGTGLQRLTSTGDVGNPDWGQIRP